MSVNVLGVQRCLPVHYGNHFSPQLIRFFHFLAYVNVSHLNPIIFEPDENSHLFSRFPRSVQVPGAGP